MMSVWNSHSEWIWTENVNAVDSYAEFFVSFEAKKHPVKLLISVDSNYTLYLNGKFLESGQYPDYPHYKVYDELDISSLCTEGENKLAITVWYYGMTNFSYYPGNSALRFEVYSDDELVAYSSVKTLSRTSLAYKSGLCKKINSILGFSFLYDTTLEDNWREGELCGFSESLAVVQELPLYKRPVKKLRVLPRRDSALIKSEENYYLYDLGAEEVGYLTLKVCSEYKQRLTVYYGEHIADGRVRGVIGNRRFSVEVIVGEGESEYTNYFRRLGLRYLEIHSQYPITVEYASVLPCVYPLNKINKCFDDPLIQKIYDTGMRTLELCMHDHYEDCPWREQAFYVMDSRNQMLAGYYAFEEYEFVRASLLLISRDNREDGLLAICFPTDKRLTIPSFCLHYFGAVYEYTVYSKDLTLAREVLPKLKALASAFASRIIDGLPESWTDPEYWNFYEWTDNINGALGQTGSVGKEAALGCLTSLGLQNFEKICALLGETGGYGEVISELNRNIYNSFFKKEYGLISNKTDSYEFNELVNAWAVLCGAVTGEEAEKICEALVSGEGLVKASLSMRCFKYDALLLVDREKYRRYILDDIRCGYKKMIDAGATSFWETDNGESDFENAGSLCHGWGAIAIYYLDELL